MIQCVFANEIGSGSVSNLCDRKRSKSLQAFVLYKINLKIQKIISARKFRREYDIDKNGRLHFHHYFSRLECQTNSIKLLFNFIVYSSERKIYL